MIVTSSIVAKPAHSATSEASSAWDGDSRSAMRLLPARSAGSGDTLTLRAGAEIRLSPGWKTYWRYPGDSGIPPHFDFSKSENLKSATVLWPAPLRFDDADGSVIGYKNSVTFPLHVVPRDPSKPVTLRLALDYAICEKICIPVHAKNEIVLGGKTALVDAAVDEAEARVPKRAAQGAKAPFAIKSVKREEGSPPRVIVEVAAPADTKVTLFAEGPTPDWALPLPDPVPGTEPGLHRFSFALDGLPGGTSPNGATLTLTAVAGEHAIEVPVRLD